MSWGDSREKERDVRKAVGSGGGAERSSGAEEEEEAREEERRVEEEEEEREEAGVKSGWGGARPSMKDLWEKGWKPGIGEWSTDMIERKRKRKSSRFKERAGLYRKRGSSHESRRKQEEKRKKQREKERRRENTKRFREWAGNEEGLSGDASRTREEQRTTER